MHFNLKNLLKSNDYTVSENTKNIYIVLYGALKKAIMTRAIDENTQLPPTRILAKDLTISRSTVLKAYDLLIADKHIFSRQGSGYFVSPIKNKKMHYNLSSRTSNAHYPEISKRGKSFVKNQHNLPYQQQKKTAFRPGLPPLDIFPIREWKKLTNAYWLSVKYSELSYSTTLGLDNLRHNIADYLNIYRNIVCDANQIIITTGSLHSLSLIGDVLIDEGDKVIMENPTYPQAYHLLKSLAAKITTTDIDHEGIILDKIKDKKPKLVYTTPSNQYPSGVKMSIKRRRALLDWVYTKNCLVIEDDYDHEFSNWENPISSIFSIDDQDRVIYLSTFNKLLHPSIRVGYMIVPTFLIQPLTALYSQSTRFVSPSVQNILSEFINKDLLNKHIRNVIKTSLERKNTFIKYFKHFFGDRIILDAKNTGLHIIGILPQHIDDQKLTKHFQDYGIIVHPYSSYFMNSKKTQGIVMGYSSVNNKRIKDSLSNMYDAYEEFIRKQ